MPDPKQPTSDEQPEQQKPKELREVDVDVNGFPTTVLADDETEQRLQQQSKPRQGDQQDDQQQDDQQQDDQQQGDDVTTKRRGAANK
jgi:hypothetical protein